MCISCGSSRASHMQFAGRTRCASNFSRSRSLLRIIPGMQSIPWWLYAFLGAFCAGLISIFAKVGMKGVNSDLATAVRSIVQAAFVVGFAAVVGVVSHVNLRGIQLKAWTAIALSGVAGGL